MRDEPDRLMLHQEMSYFSYASIGPRFPWSRWLHWILLVFIALSLANAWGADAISWIHRILGW